MHGSKGVQLRICTVVHGNPVYWCTGRTASAQHKYSNSSHLAAWVAVATLTPISWPCIAVDEWGATVTTTTTSTSDSWVSLTVSATENEVSDRSEDFLSVQLRLWSITIRVVSKISRTRSHGVPMWTKVKPVVKADCSEKSWKFDRTKVKGTTGCLHSNLARKRPFNLFLLTHKNDYSNENT